MLGPPAGLILLLSPHEALVLDLLPAAAQTRIQSALRRALAKELRKVDRVALDDHALRAMRALPRVLAPPGAGPAGTPGLAGAQAGDGPASAAQHVLPAAGDHSDHGPAVCGAPDVDF